MNECFQFGAQFEAFKSLNQNKDFNKMISKDIILRMHNLLNINDIKMHTNKLL